MKLSIALLFAVVAVAAAQRYVDPKNAAILAEARYLSGDGSFGAAYVQEDGVEFKEETSANGDRLGQYSYFDPNGKKITIKYRAGKNGFQVEGDHLPKAPAPLPVAAPRAPVPQYNPAPQYNNIPQAHPAPAPAAPYQAQGGIEDGQYRPEIHEYPYAYREDNNYNTNSVATPVAPQQNHGFNYNYQHAGALNNYQQPQLQQFQTTTPQPTRFFPPGQLDLNRTPDGFNYQFQSRQ